MLHVMRDEWPLELGDNVTVGHGVILHGCTIESRVLVGMGCTIMNGARIGTGSIIAAGTLIPEDAIVLPGSLFMGHPGKLRRELTPADRRRRLICTPQRYVEYKGNVSCGSGEIILAERQQIRAIKGVRDILPLESRAWSRVERAAQDVFGTFGFAEIRLPIFEQTELFARSVGADTDIVGKEMYTFTDRDEASISLRPEATASVVRAYIEHGMHALPGDVKHYMGPMFRRERPQKGRYRQFYQIGAEVLGPSDAPGIDAEVIEMLLAFFGRVGLEGLTLDLNSIGCKECRSKYVEVLRAELLKVKDKLGADSQRRIETNPLRVLDSKAPDEQAIIEMLPRIADHLCEACKTHFAEVRRQLDLRGITYNLNWRLVRGLDYYTRTTFEIIAPGLGSQNAVCGGGRYDGLVELLGGLPTKGIGFAIGEDRLMLSLEAAAETCC